MNKMEQVKKALEQEGITFAAISADGELRTSQKKGIRPIMELLATDPSFLKDALVADRVIGRAAALLLAKGEINALYAVLISEHAIEGLEENKIPFSYGEKVPYIINRTGEDMCPMEATVLKEKNLEKAYFLLQKKVAELMGR